MSTTATPEALACEGRWVPVRSAGDDEPIDVLRCSGCGEWGVIVRYRMFNAPATVTLDSAVASAIAQLLALPPAPSRAPKAGTPQPPTSQEDITP